ncbi:cytochrome aa3 quinol oxidase subunit IV [Paraliobacillus quinghaiensis]|uniref:Quinol oxidase subunit 4 n=1 Tax=Paraliobacillus quinghaiensis TaxID=470815 RepID=A0A917TJM7_9BACI|nr:cytochrome aa3 quinol oxidase subunit IV [Paraliobacillus quinghaiensis]GGM25666.1 cytochrome aa3 quinol oxidase subunit IV [Paraliobacillus quinghaiensis]
MKKQSMFPLNHVLGFVLSIALTVGAVFIVYQTDFSASVKMNIIGTLAIFQALIQLIMFMHITEGKSGGINIINIAYAIFLAIVVVAGSIWVLTTGHAAM